MEKRTFLMLLDKYLAGKASPEEERLLEEYYRRLDESSKLDLSAEEETMLQQLMLKNIWEQVEGKAKVIPMRPRRRMTLWYAAASIVIALSVGGYFNLHKSHVSNLKSQISKNDIAPGGNKATLTLSDGRKIVLADTHNGTIASQGQTLVQKTADGKLVYAASSPSGTVSGEPAVVYNMLTTKRGEQYQVTLPDGSKVFLNAASSLRYPVAFSGKDRLVELTGEGDFTVVHNSKQPFKVKVNGEVIEDIGTHFNINAYDDEPVTTTTLIEGAVKVTQGDQQVMLKPGYAAIGGVNSPKIGVIKTDPQSAIAWTTGNFEFNNENIKPIMRQVARWYDAEIVYEGNTERQNFVGSVSRFGNVSQVLKTLELTGTVHFKVEGRRITVMP